MILLDHQIIRYSLHGYHETYTVFKEGGWAKQLIPGPEKSKQKQEIKKRQNISFLYYFLIQWLRNDIIISGLVKLLNITHHTFNTAMSMCAVEISSS